MTQLIQLVNTRYSPGFFLNMISLHLLMLWSFNRQFESENNGLCFHISRNPSKENAVNVMAIHYVEHCTDGDI